MKSLVVLFALMGAFPAYADSVALNCRALVSQPNCPDWPMELSSWNGQFQVSILASDPGARPPKGCYVLYQGRLSNDGVLGAEREVHFFPNYGGFPYPGNRIHPLGRLVGTALPNELVWLQSPFGNELKLSCRNPRPAPTPAPAAPAPQLVAPVQSRALPMAVMNAMGSAGSCHQSVGSCAPGELTAGCSVWPGHYGAQLCNCCAGSPAAPAPMAAAAPMAGGACNQNWSYDPNSSGTRAYCNDSGYVANCRRTGSYGGLTCSCCPG